MPFHFDLNSSSSEDLEVHSSFGVLEPLFVLVTGCFAGV